MESRQKKMRLKLIIFDFDGVLANTFHINHKVMQYAFPNLSEEDFKGLHDGNVWDKKEMQGYRLNTDKDFDKERTKLLKDLEIEPAIEELLAYLAEEYPMTIVSSGSEEHIGNYLASQGIGKFFKRIYGFETHPSKVVKFEMIFEEHELAPEECLFVTDTLGDLIEANHVLLPAIAVSWGFHERERLEKGFPIKIVDTVKELRHAISEIERKA